MPARQHLDHMHLPFMLACVMIIHIITIIVSIDINMDARG